MGAHKDIVEGAAQVNNVARREGRRSQLAVPLRPEQHVDLGRVPALDELNANFDEEGIDSNGSEIDRSEDVELCTFDVETEEAMPQKLMDKRRKEK